LPRGLVPRSILIYRGLVTRPTTVNSVLENSSRVSWELASEKLMVCPSISSPQLSASSTHSPSLSGMRPETTLSRLTPEVMEFARNTRSLPSMFTSTSS